MRLCLLSLPGPVPGLLGSWGQIGALLFFQGVRKHLPPPSIHSLSSRYPAGPTQAPAQVRLGEETRHSSHAQLGLCPGSATL